MWLYEINVQWKGIFHHEVFLAALQPSWLFWLLNAPLPGDPFQPSLMEIKMMCFSAAGHGSYLNFMTQCQNLRGSLTICEPEKGDFKHVADTMKRSVFFILTRRFWIPESNQLVTKSNQLKWEKMQKAWN